MRDDCDKLWQVERLPDEQCLCKTLVGMGIFVDRQPESQWEWLARLSQAGDQRTEPHHSGSEERRQQQPDSAGEEQALFIEVRPDPERERRKGVPEVIFGEAKEPGQVVAMARTLLSKTGRAIISRVRPEAIGALQAAFPTCIVSVRENAHAVVIARPDYVRRNTGGLVGVISAGTSDIAAAEEAALIAEEMGCRVMRVYDVGVAGLHRLVEPLHELFEAGVDVLIVAAGMDGALPSVIAGLAPVPVIGLPTSIGYGLGGNGIAALLSMLQTCAPGLVVVNIDNGIGAGSTAALIANHAARGRQQEQQSQ
jgi:NCAIR mutase (PurE)-related protein